ncbi:MAG: TIM barrel protein [Candidatus Limnocylindrales bacterium]
MRLGTAPITWGVCEMDGWGERLPYPRVLDEMRSLGFTGTELGPSGYLPADPEALLRVLAERDLALVGSFCPILAPRDRDGADRAFAEAHALTLFLAATGAPFLVLADAGDDARLAVAGRAGGPDAPGLDDDGWRWFAETAERLGDDANAHGVRAVFHPEAGSYVETEDEIEELLSRTDPALVGFCLDTGHVAYGGGDPVALARRHAERILHVHAKDVDPAILARVRDEGLGYLEAASRGIFVPAGAGMVDFAGVCAMLDLARSDRWVIVEQDIRLGLREAPQDPVANARASRAHLLELAGRSR